MRLVMNAGHEYQIYGKLVRSGEQFTVPEDEGLIWCKIGRARLAPPPLPTVQEEGTVKAGYEKATKQRYNRRDVVAAEDQ